MRHAPRPNERMEETEAKKHAKKLLEKLLEKHGKKNTRLEPAKNWVGATLKTVPNRLYNNRPIRHRQQGSAFPIPGGLREGRRGGVLGTCKSPPTVRLPVRVRSPLRAQLPEYCNEMASPWSAHMHLNCRFFRKTRAYLISWLSVLSWLLVDNMVEQQIQEAQ